MNGAAQVDIWKELTAHINFTDLVLQARNPDEFQVELVNVIDRYFKNGSNVLEAGSFTGITSLSLDDRFAKTLLDLNPGAVQLSERLFNHFGKNATFVVGDMFEMPFKDGTFDVIFNAGVLEHFDFNNRVRALKEYSRVLRSGGVMIIGYPNHYSRPYRLVYEYLNRVGRWPFPQEHMLFDLKEEAESAGLQLNQRIVAAEKTSFQYLNYFNRPYRWVLKMFFMLTKYQGYFTAVVIGKE